MTAEILVDVVLAVLVVETCVLAWAGRRRGRVPPFGRLWPTLAAGFCLALAVRAAVVGASTGALAALLAAGGVAHAIDLVRRMSR